MNHTNTFHKHIRQLALLTASGLLLALTGGTAGAVCAPRTNCKPKISASGCGPKAMHTMKSGCGPMKHIPKQVVTRPAGTHLYDGASQAELVSLGERMFKDTKLSSNGLSCFSCHANHASYRPSFAKPYPHFVKMADDQAGIQSIHLDEIVQFCLISPMAGKPLPWDSKELAALTAYTATQQATFHPDHSTTMPMKGGCGPKTAPCTPRN